MVYLLLYISYSRVIVVCSKLGCSVALCVS